MKYKVAIARSSMRGLGTLAAAALLILSTPVWSQDFVAYEGKNAIREGEGGARKTVEGVDFWSDGAPPRKFQLLGYITDRRQKTGLIGMARMSSLEKDVAEVVKKNGGNAVILMNSEAETVGAIGAAQANTVAKQTNAFGMSVGVQKQNSKYAVLKYLVEPPAAVAAPAPAVSSPVIDGTASPAAAAAPANPSDR